MKTCATTIRVKNEEDEDQQVELFILGDGLLSLDINRGSDTGSLLVCEPKEMKATLEALLVFLEDNE